MASKEPTGAHETSAEARYVDVQVAMRLNGTKLCSRPQSAQHCKHYDLIRVSNHVLAEPHSSTQHLRSILTCSGTTGSLL